MIFDGIDDLRAEHGTIEVWPGARLTFRPSCGDHVVFIEVAELARDGGWAHLSCWSAGRAWTRWHAQMPLPAMFRHEQWTWAQIDQEAS